MTERDTLAREEYARRPALAPFSRVPISFDLADRLGTRSASDARRRADARTNNEKGNTDDRRR